MSVRNRGSYFKTDEHIYYEAMRQANVVELPGPFEPGKVCLAFRKDYPMLAEVERVIDEEELNINRIFTRYKVGMVARYRSEGEQQRKIGCELRMWKKRRL